MDNVCHTLVGVAVAQAGFKGRTALATATGAIAANLPDLDVLVFATDIPSVAFRRGITHGVPAQLLLPVACAAIMWAIARRRAAAGPPAHFGPLLVLSYIGIFTHVFLDFLNTYGIRLLSPLSQKWFYGDAVFIVDPWLWLILGLGALVARRRSDPRPARLALALAALYVGAMLVSARAARAIVEDAWMARSGQPALGLMVGPVPITPFRKSVIVDAGDRYVEGTFTWLPTRVTFGDEVTPKNDAAVAVEAARQDPDVAGLLVWSRFPFWEVHEVNRSTEVRLRDMRFKRLGAAGFTAATFVR